MKKEAEVVHGFIHSAIEKSTRPLLKPDEGENTLFPELRFPDISPKTMEKLQCSTEGRQGYLSFYYPQMPMTYNPADSEHRRCQCDP
jgi:hypothetical protein